MHRSVELNVVRSHPGFDTTAPETVRPAIICFSHLRWDFVTQRPQHLMRRFSAQRRVFFWEEHIPCDHSLPYLEFHSFADDNIIALRPRLPHWWDPTAIEAGLRNLLDMLVLTALTEPPILWVYAPIMYRFAKHLRAAATVYDCMDELAAFRFAHPNACMHEGELIDRADVMFTGGHSLYEAKRCLHNNIHSFPSAVDTAHFDSARTELVDPENQRSIPFPRLGYFGVIDERLDLELLDTIARLQPDWSYVMVGPIVKIDAALLPRRGNIFWLGSQSYADLPAYLAGWDVALMPFAMNAATRFISPTKTPEYLAGGRPVVSTPVVDVVRHYGALQGVKIASDAESFVDACKAAMTLPRAGAWLQQADQLLANMSWDRTFDKMSDHVGAAVDGRRQTVAVKCVNDLCAAPSIRAALRRPDYDVLIVGAGFAGSVLAERFASGSGQRVLLIDQRDHIGGNAYDHHDAAGILVHRYGPHIFHTNSQGVFDYLSQFTRWRAYEHRVLAAVAGRLLPIPINRTTLNRLYDINLKDEREAAAFLASRAEPHADIRNSEDVVVAAVGRELYNTFFRGYTRKQWGLDPSELDRTVTARVPARTDTDDRYFLDRFQAMPADGYTRMFENMLDHDLIKIQLNTSLATVQGQVTAAHIVFTGPIDEYFNYRFGRLPYRSLEFRHETLDRKVFQPVAVVNYPSETVPYTRITEYKHLTGQWSHRTSISYEFPSSEGDPYYPIPRPDNQAVYQKYEALADATTGVTFAGRLATYRYYNMDQVVAQALATYRRLTQAADQSVTSSIS